MDKSSVFRIITGIAAVVMFALVPTPAVAATPSVTVCSGTLPPGTYQAITVATGQTCDLGVGPVNVLAGVSVQAGATFMLGYEGGPGTGTIHGGIVASHAAQVQVHGAQISGGVAINGGSGPFGCTEPFAPLCFTDFEDNSIRGGVTINGYNGFWLGFIRNQVNGTVAFANNSITHDEIDIGSNIINGSLLCHGNDPLENTGHSAGGPNSVTGIDTCHESGS